VPTTQPKNFHSKKEGTITHEKPLNNPKTIHQGIFMPLLTPSQYSTSTGYNVTIATYGKRSVEELEQSLAEVSNSLSASGSSIHHASRALAQELAPVLKEALRHEKAARSSIEKVLDVFYKKLPKLTQIDSQLNEGRMYREGFQEGKSLAKKAKKLYKEMFAASDTLLGNPVIGNKNAEEALEHAKSLAQELENRLG
jgi:hypothetical protein